jgi:hypothetical protein
MAAGSVEGLQFAPRRMRSRALSRSHRSSQAPKDYMIELVMATTPTSYPRAPGSRTTRPGTAGSSTATYPRTTQLTQHQCGSMESCHPPDAAAIPHTHRSTSRARDPYLFWRMPIKTVGSIRIRRPYLLSVMGRNQPYGPRRQWRTRDAPPQGSSSPADPCRVAKAILKRK